MTGSTAETLDVVFANKNTDELKIARNGNWDLNKYPKETWEPIGVVVIPGEHEVLKDGTGEQNQCGVMSLVTMNYSTPESGGKYNQGIYWGGYGIDISGKSDGLSRYDSVTNGLTNYNKVNYVGSNGNVNAEIQGTRDYRAYLPSDAFSIVKNPYDDKTWYRYNDSDHYYAPSPYNNDGSFNPIYNQTISPASEYNSLSDFKGIANTKIITDLATSQSDWRTASTITHNSGSGYYPAACCCARFKTVGTKAFVDCSIEELRNGTGFWYLPAMGELGYVMVRKKAINDTISKIKAAYGIGTTIDSNSYYWSSSEVSNYYLCRMNMDEGDAGIYAKDSFFHSRAFMRL